MAEFGVKLYSNVPIQSKRTDITTINSLVVREYNLASYLRLQYIGSMSQWQETRATVYSHEGGRNFPS